MTENEFVLFDRLEIIKSTIEKYGEDNFYISFSGGKDSTVLHHLIDMALPGNNIPRVFSNTGIEYISIVTFVNSLMKTDKRFIMVCPTRNIRRTLETYGYPFKGKMHSKWLDNYQRNGMHYAIKNYLGEGDKKLFRPCPKILKYQFTEDFPLRVSDKCCIKMKEEPLKKWQKENNKPYAILGIMREEGGRRVKSECAVFENNKLVKFQPMAKVSRSWEEWFIKEHNISLCSLYYEPYNFTRTGCKGCPFAIELQKELDILEKYFPNERKQCEIIWKPVYDEYRRIGYRLKGEN